MEEQVVKDAESKQKSAAKLKASKREAYMTEPTEKDILTGSGYGQQKRAGNIWYNDYMNSKYVAYGAIDERKQKQRTEFSLRCVKELKDDGRHFFGRQDNGVWTLLSESGSRTVITEKFKTIQKQQTPRFNTCV